MKKLIFIMGSTGCGKTKLSIDLALLFSGEVINSDKIQVYKGLDIATNKVTDHDQKGVPHHLLGFIDDPNQDFTTQDFCTQTLAAIDRITSSGRVPIVVGGSNSYIQSFVETLESHSYVFCFIWLDVSLPVLYNRVCVRVDEMVQQGLVGEVREAFTPARDYGRGLWRAIGVEEFEAYFLAEKDPLIDELQKQGLLKKAIEEMKINTCLLAANQRDKIERLRRELGWKIRRVDATEVVGEEAWIEFVLHPTIKIVSDFIKN